MELDEIRKEIDQIDPQLQALFERRMELCLQIAKYKHAHHMQVFQRDRERAVLNSVGRRAAEGLEEASRVLFSNIVSISSALQQKMLAEAAQMPQIDVPRLDTATLVGCQGTTGSNSEAAVKALFPGRKVLFFPTFAHVLAAVEAGQLEYGVLPIYNSTSGTVTQTVDLMRKYNFFIAAANQVRVVHCLAALPGVRIGDIDVVYSHPQALSQCSDFLDAHHLRRRDYSNTATAAQMVSEAGDATIAAICSEEAAKKYRLQVLASAISNVLPNYTQFICVTKDMQVAEDASVVSIMLTILNEPGALSRVLNKFNMYGLDMTKLESRPLQDGSFNVVFYIDFKGNLRDRNIAAFLDDLCRSCKEFWLLGNA